MECNTNILESALPAITALAAVLLTLIVQSFIERGRRKHVSSIESRIPLMTACEDLNSLLNEQASALTEMEGLVKSGGDTSTHPSLRVLVEKSYRKKVWAIIDDQKCVKPLNHYALTIEGLAEKLWSGNLDADVLTEIANAKIELGRTMKNVTKHTAEIWDLKVIRE